MQQLQGVSLSPDNSQRIGKYIVIPCNLAPLGYSLAQPENRLHAPMFRDTRAELQLSFRDLRNGTFSRPDH